jgi:hypothetical protein
MFGKYLNLFILNIRNMVSIFFSFLFILDSAIKIVCHTHTILILSMQFRNRKRKKIWTSDFSKYYAHLLLQGMYMASNDLRNAINEFMLKWSIEKIRENLPILSQFDKSYHRMNRWLCELRMYFCLFLLWKTIKFNEKKLMTQKKMFCPFSLYFKDWYLYTISFFTFCDFFLIYTHTHVYDSFYRCSSVTKYLLSYCTHITWQSSVSMFVLL